MERTPNFDAGLDFLDTFLVLFIIGILAAYIGNGGTLVTDGASVVNTWLYCRRQILSCLVLASEDLG